MQVYSPAPSLTPRPFLKWAGGKNQLIPQYSEFFPPSFHTYYEPFLGGGAIFFHLAHRINHAVLTDINPELVNVYRCIRDHVEAVIERLAEHRQNHGKDYYYTMRSLVSTCPIERAARFIYLNKTCFNGLYRENSQGQFNVPIGRYKNPGIFDPDLLCAASAALQSAELFLGSFESVVEQAYTEHDFVYFDPPYYPISPTSSFTKYNRYAFTETDQIHLRDTFRTLASRGVQVMLSNSDCDFIRDLYAGFNIHTISATRLINCNAKRRGKISEVLVTSY
ncbi:MAG: DNA adenine methylase [Synechococcales cyanobacterium T60_A2020_003]|nr:DNA adenine methylase [Synechococcales cyanobacterium T60_A2020_003]